MASGKNGTSSKSSNSQRNAFFLAFAGFIGVIVFSHFARFLRCRDNYPEWIMLCLSFSLLASVAFLLYGGAKFGWIVVFFPDKRPHFSHFIAKTLCSVAGLAVSLMLLLGVMLPQLGAATEKAQRISCAANLKQIGIALQQYARDYDAFLPPGNAVEAFSLLRNENYLSDYKIYLCPSSWRSECPNAQPLREDLISYLYLGAGIKATRLRYDEIIALDNPGNHRNYGNALLANGTVKSLVGEDWKRACAGAGSKTSDVLKP